MSLRVAVIGAGVAGVHVATRLAQDGHLVTLFDREAGNCQGASGNPAGAFHAHLSKHDVPLSRLTRLGVQATLNSLQFLTQSGWMVKGHDWDNTGHIQLTDDAADAARWHAIWLANPHLHAQVQWLAPDEVSARLGIATQQAGLLYADAGWVVPRAWCNALIAHATNVVQNSGQGRLELRWSKTIESVHVDVDGRCTLDGVAYDRVVIAAAFDSLALHTQTGVTAQRVKGQVSLIQAPHNLPHVVSGAAYAVPLPQQRWLIGATFERPAVDCDVTTAGHADNAARLGRAFPTLPYPTVLGGRSAMRTVWPDRLPAIGPALDSAGLPSQTVWFATGYGSRGLTWAALGAQVLSTMWQGLAGPLTYDLLSAVLPGRFFSRASNSKPTFPSFPKTR